MCVVCLRVLCLFAACDSVLFYLLRFVHCVLVVVCRVVRVVWWLLFVVCRVFNSLCVVCDLMYVVVCGVGDCCLLFDVVV